MYERYFGITGPPFRLSPDPAFLFESEQHRSILSTMRQVFSHTLPFLVVSGEMGAGKTTMLRAWLGECEAAGVAVAQLVNTQLDAADMVWAIAAGFGIGVTRGANADPAASLRSFFRGLNTRAALLVVDEAQNLNRTALHALVGLAETAAEANAVFRICLAGQPELRAHVADPALPGLHARVQQACHLGALEPAQTRQYIEHRLLKVGWTGRPSFDVAAFGEIHRLTGGVPRRINVLCNRLMLSQFLSDTDRIDARSVIVAASALRAEVSDGVIVQAPPRSAFRSAQDASIPQGALLIVTSGRSDHIKAVPLLHAIGSRRDLPPPLIVTVADARVWQLDRDFHDCVGLAHMSLADDLPPRFDQVATRFRRLVEQCRPSAVIVFDGDPVSQACSTIAREHKVPLVHVGTDTQGIEELADPGSARVAIGQIAGLRFHCQPGTQAGDSVRAAPSFSVGNLLIAAVQTGVQMALKSARCAEQLAPSAESFADRRGYGVVALKQVSEGAGSLRSEETLAVLRAVSRDLPLVWPVRRWTRSSNSGHALARSLEGYRIACIEELGHAHFVDLLFDATCVLTDSLDVIEEAAALRVPCLSLGVRHVGQGGANGWLSGIAVGFSVNRATRAVWEIMFNGDEPMALPALWDGHAGTRIAAQLARWLSDGRTSASVLVLDALQPPR